MIDYIRHLKTDINQINHLVTSFLLYSQSQDKKLILKKQKVNLHHWLDSLMKPYELSKINLQYQPITNKNISVSIDPKLLKHAVENILVNALKFASHQIIVSSQITNNTIHITIEDDGPGIVATEREKIFDAFATLDSSDSVAGHIGLGLSIARSIIHLHSGSITIHDSALGGCAVKIKLPLDS